MDRIAPSPSNQAALLGLDVNGIMWTDRTINPGLAGCAKVSPACTSCYAEITAAGIVRKGRSPKSAPAMRATADFYAEGLTADGRWTGRVSVHPERIGPAFADLPKKASAKTRRVFFSMIDLFHVDVPFAFIDAVFAEMEGRPWIVFQVLTKRADRMAEYAAYRARRAAEFPLRQWDDDSQVAGPLRRLHAAAAGTEYDLAACGARLRYLFPGETANEEAAGAAPTCPACRATIAVWPANVWAGVTVEDQRRADERIPHLLQVPAAVRFLSVEPMLGAIDLRLVRWWPNNPNNHHKVDVLRCGFWSDATRVGVDGFVNHSDMHEGGCGGVNWVIVGSESDGPRPGARVTDPAWVLDLVDQCDRAEVPVFVKQIAIRDRLIALPLIDGRPRADFPA